MDLNIQEVINMNDFNNNNFNNGTSNQGFDANQNTQNTQNAQNVPPQNAYSYSQTANNQSNPNMNGYNPNADMNEFSYKPKKPKKPIGAKILAGVIAVLCVAAIGTTSIVGYKLVTGKSIGTSDTSSSTSAKATTDKASSSATSTVDRTNLPTLEQLAAPADAMSIPDIVTKVSPSVVGISCILDGGTSTGSGIIMSADGYIITNAHVIADAKSISVVLPSAYYSDSSSSTDSSSTDSTSDENLTYTAELVGSDTQSDVAVLKIDKTGLTAAELGTSEGLQVGELSIVIGNPLGLSLANSVTAGIISATDRTLTVEDRTMNLIQTDASVNSGNSGGPLINAYGQVIGITSAKVSSSVGEGLGFAIPIDEALPIINDLMENGYVTGRPSLGITGTDVTSAYSTYYGIPQGFLVASVTDGGAAAKAGIQQNDIIIAINDTVISSISELNEIKNKCAVGDTVTLTVYRNGKMVDVDVVLGESTGDEQTTTTDDTTTEQQQQQQQQQDLYDQYKQYFNNYGY